MAGLNHDFLLSPDIGAEYDYSRVMSNDPDAVQLHDDIIGFMWDTLLWIPTINPCCKPTDRDYTQYGLNRWGPTVINYVGAKKGAAVFRCWAALYVEGPEELELKGPWEWIEGEDAKSGSYAVIRENRDQLVHRLEQIAGYCESAVSGQCYVLHGGI
jgi:hypothetical protein